MKACSALLVDGEPCGQRGEPREICVREERSSDLQKANRKLYVTVVLCQFHDGQSDREPRRKLPA